MIKIITILALTLLAQSCNFFAPTDDQIRIEIKYPYSPRPPGSIIAIAKQEDNGNLEAYIKIACKGQESK